jgi:hypothetical protein
MAGEVRLGVIFPSAYTVVEEWYPRVVPSKAGHDLGKKERIDAEIEREQDPGPSAGRGHGLSHLAYSC